MTNEKDIEIRDIENMGEFQYLNFIIDHETLDFVGYEFEGKEIVIEESGCEQSLFRMDVDKKTGIIEVYAAYSEDFDIMEEVSCYFDTKKLFADIKKYMEQNEVDNQGEVYVKYIKFINEGYECDDAVTKAYGY
ncbi:hypothetical protein NSQ59_27445 [Margalitia sp. FSL K6-0131]|uniref:hypothetical protein n=1 Tax=Margalitia sp. FSL K6-0131 TaxID=2954604 RepID=UPI0030FBAE51